MDQNLLKNILQELFESMPLYIPNNLTKKLATKAVKTYIQMSSKQKS
jgi:hypothetical protein